MWRKEERFRWLTEGVFCWIGILYVLLYRLKVKLSVRAVDRGHERGCGCECKVSVGAGVAASALKRWWLRKNGRGRHLVGVRSGYWTGIMVDDAGGEERRDERRRHWTPTSQNG